MKTIPSNIIISRTDSIGDVVLTLPMAGILKKYFPEIKICFLAKSYTRPVVEACKYVDKFIDEKDFLQKEILIGGKRPQAIIHVFPVGELARRAKQIGIPLRIGTTNRFYHWFTCNSLVRLSRKNSYLHESQLNIALLKPFGINTIFSLPEIAGYYGIEKIQPLHPAFSLLIDREKYNLILHPKSQGNGREWPLENFIELIRQLNPERYKIFISGTDKEKSALKILFNEVGNLVTDITGRMDLSQFIAFINQCNGLVASGTGPLHIAAALGKDAVGIFPPIRPVHPGRWQPVGAKAHFFVEDKACNDCKMDNAACACIKNIKPLSIKEYLDLRANATY